MKIILPPESHYYQQPSLNRGLQTFTSFISDDCKMVFLDSHLDRLLNGAHWLFPKNNWIEERDEIRTLMARHFDPHRYFRIMVFDDNLVFSSDEHRPKPISLRAQRAISIKTETMLPPYVKSPAYLIAEAELRIASTMQSEDILFYDENNFLCEASTSNVFIVVSGRKIITPVPSSKVLSGVTRLMLIEFLRKNHYDIEERNVVEQEVLESSEIWLTNAVSGVRYLDHYDNKNKEHTLFDEVLRGFGRYGERYE